MSKVIRLTESDLHNMIKEAINELDWRTYASAARKENDNERYDKFANAAKESFLKQYNNGFDTDKYHIGCNPTDINSGVGYVDYSGRDTGNFHHLCATNKYNDDNYYKKLGGYNASKNRFESPIIGDPDIEITDLKAREQFKKAANDYRCHHKGKSYYNPDTHAWENKKDNNNEDYKNSNVNKQQNNNSFFKRLMKKR